MTASSDLPKGAAATIDGVVQQGRASPPDLLLQVEHEYTSALGLLDGDAMVRRLAGFVPDLAGVDAAWVGQSIGDDRVMLRHAVNAVSQSMEGLIVPSGAGLGGKVVAARRPFWVDDYRFASTITHEFDAQVEAEGIRSAMAVPIIHGSQLLGVLYGTNRHLSSFGDRTAMALEAMASRIATAQVIAERVRNNAEIAVHEERRRLAGVLQDKVADRLGATLFTLRASLELLGDEPQLDPETRIRLAEIEQRAAETSAALGHSLAELRAPVGRGALREALREHCAAFSRRTGISASMMMLTEVPALPSTRTRALADTALMALHMVEENTTARSVVVSVFARRDGVSVTVTGDMAGIARRGGYEIDTALISERLAPCDGTVTIGSNEDGGVTVHAWVPV
jgi:signal transduction histidine kinase